MSENSETPTAKRRKAQVVSAAAECFRRDGFHRSSMSRISAAAGMSSGHIYHYFARKEDIVEALVAQEESELALLVHDVERAAEHSDVVSAISDLAERTAERYMDREHAGLAMEILAESVRNPEISKLIAESDTDVRRSFETLLGERTPESVSRCALVASLLDGLSVRSIRHPGVAADIDRVMLAKVVRFMLTA
ncbi:TetR/AcrR family transcriptional regulator [Stenotrophomonas sp. S41]|uniref:TetR/AcrR family transcriptional regulator n=1 Tax=Stenotrophomonas sp. S41 TaxID=2767464 RepID=UPI001909EB90|nr:TetR/AcrR family transcriptional regulator [Stenotrophomonas sp. S41]MBK0010766.1 TetR/AcrR family transcriptional regulator [Stenotrophomonas sp. S41]